MSNEGPITILLQGDSITDAGRNPQFDRHRGSGYPTIIAAELGFREPCRYNVINRGISGNRVPDLYARWKIDCINLKPDVISILIGVNDVWHELAVKNGVSAPKFEMIYDLLLAETREELPDTRIMILEPFVLKGSATTDAWTFFDTEVKLRAEASRRVAEKHKALFVPLQSVFDRACEGGIPTDTWLSDGVHPSAAGHMLITREWIKAFDSLS